MAHRFPSAIVALAAALPLAGCMTTQQIVREDGTARLGETTRAGPLLVHPTRIVEDSRCPINARCVWAGRLVVRTSVTSGTARETHDLTLGEPIAVAGGSLVLDSGEPGKMAERETDPDAYRLHFSFSD